MASEPSKESTKDRILLLESVMRDLVSDILQDTFGDGWLVESGLTKDRIAVLKSRAKEESKRRRGINPDPTILAYSDLHDLKRAITRNWAVFKPVFVDQKSFAVDFARLEAARVAQMHGRPLAPHEQDLVRGIVGELRNRIAIYRGKAMKDPDRWFPTIEEVVDSFGNRTTASSTFCWTGLVLHPSDMLSFELSASDPQGHPFSWHYDDGPSAHSLSKVIDGQRLDLKLTEDHIGVDRHISFFLVSDRRYHRSGWHDGHVVFYYQVLPLSE